MIPSAPAPDAARKPLAALLLGLLAGGVGISPLATTGLRDTRSWREGPVRYIITAEEDREFRQLDTDEARARFIETFWARRDREPSTLINEYRREFWDRVATSNRMFAQSSKPGWKTDRGRYYILLGAPDDRDASLEQAPPGLGRVGVRGAIVWRYQHSPNEDVGTGLTILFIRDASGEFRASTDPALMQRAISGSLTFGGLGAGSFGIPLPQLPPRMTELQLMLDLGRLEEVPSEEDLLTAIVRAEEFYGVIPLFTRYDFFAGTGSDTSIAMTLNLHPDPMDPERAEGQPEYLIVGRVDPESGSAVSSEPIFLRESDFVPAARNTDSGYNGPFIYQTIAQLPPGAYRLSIAAFDRLTNKTGTYTDTLLVPGFAKGRMALSSLCLSEEIHPLEGSIDEDGGAYVIGRLRVTPRLVPTYRNGETFAVYYQVYSAATDPDTASPALQIEYQFYVLQGAAYMPIGKPILFGSVGNSAQGWSFPLNNWPMADFKLRVTVTDTFTGQTASREVTFRVQ